jgi:hypothetical protein
MLISFRAENVRSFRDEMELSLLATPQTEERFARTIEWREAGHPLKLLPVAGIFGANASGKSNVLEAMDDLRMYVLDSFRRDLTAGEYWPFRLSVEAESRPSRYEVELVLHGIRHEYGFVLNKERVLEEWAFRYPKGRAATLFTRVGDVVEAGSAARGETRAVEKLLRGNSLLLSAAAAANHSLLQPLHEWFRRNLQLAHFRNRTRRQALTVEMLQADDDPNDRDRVLRLLRAADLGIVDAKRRTLDPRVKERMQRAIRALVGEDGGIDDREIDESLELGTFGFSLVHQGMDKRLEFPPGFESVGTEVWLGLIGTVICALTDGTVLLVDELDASLHPSLVAQLVRLFQDPATNPRRAQLIFNSHDPTILGDSGEDRLLGRDQTWFTEKISDGSTRLYPLTDFKPRKNEAVGKRYLAGRYGAMPILSRHDFDALTESIESGE